MSDKLRVWPGLPYPCGATWDGKGVNFAVFSAHAERVELCLFDSVAGREHARITLPEYTDEVWHGYLPDIGPGQLYAYRATGDTIRRAATASTTTSCCSILMRRPSSANSVGATPNSAISLARRPWTCRSVDATVLAGCRSAK